METIPKLLVLKMLPNVQIIGEDHHKSSSKILNDLRSENFLTDVTLVTEDFHLIPAHKIILTAMSGYFGKLFRLQVNSKETLICLQSVNYLELTQIIKYIYHGEVEVPEDNLDKFLGLAERFNLKGLMQVNSKNALLDRQGEKASKKLKLDRQVEKKEALLVRHVETDSQEILDKGQVENNREELLIEVENDSQGILMNGQILKVEQLNQDADLGNIGKRKLRKIKEETNQHNKLERCGTLFPHPRNGEKRRRCQTCIEDIYGEGYSEARRKLAPLYLQCQKCTDSTCKDHHFVVCQNCATSLKTTDNNVDSDDDSNSD